MEDLNCGTFIIAVSDWWVTTPTSRFEILFHGFTGTPKPVRAASLLFSLFRRYSILCWSGSRIHSLTTSGNRSQITRREKYSCEGSRQSKECNYEQAILKEKKMRLQLAVCLFTTWLQLYKNTGVFWRLPFVFLFAQLLAYFRENGLLQQRGNPYCELHSI